MVAAILEAKGIKAEAARLVGCGWNTVTTYIKKYPSCQTAYEQAVAQVSDKAKSNIVSAIDDGDLGESHWWLVKKDPEFKDRSTVDHNLDPVTFAQLVALAHGDKD